MKLNEAIDELNQVNESDELDLKKVQSDVDKKFKDLGLKVKLKRIKQVSAVQTLFESDVDSESFKEPGLFLALDRYRISLMFQFDNIYTGDCYVTVHHMLHIMGDKKPKSISYTYRYAGGRWKTEW